MFNHEEQLFGFSVKKLMRLFYRIINRCPEFISELSNSPSPTFSPSTVSQKSSGFRAGSLPLADSDVPVSLKCAVLYINLAIVTKKSAFENRYSGIIYYHLISTS